MCSFILLHPVLWPSVLFFSVCLLVLITSSSVLFSPVLCCLSSCLVFPSYPILCHSGNCDGYFSRLNDSSQKVIIAAVVLSSCSVSLLGSCPFLFCSCMSSKTLPFPPLFCLLVSVIHPSVVLSFVPFSSDMSPSVLSSSIFFCLVLISSPPLYCVVCCLTAQRRHQSSRTLRLNDRQPRWGLLCQRRGAEDLLGLNTNTQTQSYDDGPRVLFILMECIALRFVYNPRYREPG